MQALADINKDDPSTRNARYDAEAIALLKREGYLDAERNSGHPICHNLLSAG
jgi:hypothetical protein